MAESSLTVPAGHAFSVVNVAHGRFVPVLDLIWVAAVCDAS